MSTVLKRTGNDGVCRGNRRDDVFDNTLCQTVGDSLNVVLFSASKSGLVQPLNVFWIVSVYLSL